MGGGGKEDPSNRCKKSYKTNLLPLSARYKQCLSRSARLGLSGHPQKPLVIAEKSGASLKQLSWKITTAFHSFFPPRILSFGGFKI